VIPQAYITEWSNFVPWQTNEQVEQDLVICRALVAIFQDTFLANHLAFRGGTALHKLYLQPQPRYSEDIDLVQITAEPFGPIIDKIKERLAFLGQAKVKVKANNTTLIYRFESEFAPVQTLSLKVETNCREHFAVLGYQKFPFEVNSSWFQGKCEITTYAFEELLGTKLRALYQRRKGRDLYDIYKAITTHPQLDTEKVVRCYQKYMEFVVKTPPTKQVFIENMEVKIKDKEFLGDTMALLRPDEKYPQEEAYELVKHTLIEKIIP
jgi:predicted nucleotidyltransferase component of viral defense system